jgi:hypothetical protein
MVHIRHVHSRWNRFQSLEGGKANQCIGRVVSFSEEFKASMHHGGFNIIFWYRLINEHLRLFSELVSVKRRCLTCRFSQSVMFGTIGSHDGAVSGGHFSSMPKVGKTSAWRDMRDQIKQNQHRIYCNCPTLTFSPALGNSQNFSLPRTA